MEAVVDTEKVFSLIGRKVPIGRRGKRAYCLNLIYTLYRIGETFRVRDLPKPKGIHSQTYSGVIMWMKGNRLIDYDERDPFGRAWRLLDKPVWIKAECMRKRVVVLEPDQ